MIDEIQVPSPKTLIIPGLAGLYARLSTFSYAIARVMMGLVLLPAEEHLVDAGGEEHQPPHHPRNGGGEGRESRIQSGQPGNDERFGRGNLDFVDHGRILSEFPADE